jgi:hypothetical protein
MAISIPIVSEFNSKGIKSAINEFKSLEGAGAKAQFALKKAAVPAAAALTALAGAATISAKAAMEDQAQQQELARQIQSVTGATDQQIKENERLIASMERQFAVSDGQLRPALGQLVRGTGDLTRAQKLMEVALDISAATGKDLESVTVALSKAENGQYTALQRLGIPLGENTKSLQALTKAEKEREAALASVSKLDSEYAGKLELSKAEKEKYEKATLRLANAEFLLAEASQQAGDYATDLANVFGGAAAKSADTLEGRTRRMTIALDNAKENIGFALMPVIEAVIPVLEKMSFWIQDNTKVAVIIGGVIAGVASAVLVANAAMKVYQATLVIVKVAQAALNFVMAANPIGLVVIAIAALVAALVLAYNKSETFREGVHAMFEFVKTAIGASVNLIKGYLTFVMNFYKTIFNGIAKAWNSTIGKISFKTPDWLPGIGGKSFSIPNIPELAEGGIVNSPTLALIGEAGPEAVVPLSRMGQMGGITINIHSQVADARLGDVIVNALKQYNRRSGPIQVQVA